MKNYYETIKEVNATIYNTPLTIPKATELVHVPNCGTGSGYAVKDTTLLVSLGAGEHDAKTRYAYVPAKAVFAARLLRPPIKAKSDNWQETVNAWKVTIAGQEFDYFTGSGIDKAPCYDDVMNCLLGDSEALNQAFDEWAQELGYDTDSREAYAIWEARCENARKLIKTGIDLNAERERLQDY